MAADPQRGHSRPSEARIESKRSTTSTTTEPAVDAAPDLIVEMLRRALLIWSHERDPRGVRRTLLEVLGKLDDLP